MLSTIYSIPARVATAALDARAFPATLLLRSAQTIAAHRQLGPPSEEPAARRLSQTLLGRFCDAGMLYRSVYDCADGEP